MKYGLLALLAVAILPGCGCLRKDSGKKEKKEKIRAPKRVTVEQMPSAHIDDMAMQPELEIQEKVGTMPEMNNIQPIAEEPMGIEPMEMPVQEDRMPEMMEMDMEEENLQF